MGEILKLNRATAGHIQHTVPHNSSLLLAAYIKFQCIGASQMRQLRGKRYKRWLDGNGESVSWPYPAVTVNLAILLGNVVLAGSSHGQGTCVSCVKFRTKHRRNARWSGRSLYTFTAQDTLFRSCMDVYYVLMSIQCLSIQCLVWHILLCGISLSYNIPIEYNCPIALLLTIALAVTYIYLYHMTMLYTVSVHCVLSFMGFWILNSVWG